MDRPLNIVILGGGTAGWMAAVALASLLPRSRYAVQLIESEEIGIVGVGEATLPHMKYFNDLVGIDEAEMMRATRATFKLGIEFVDWGYKGASYIHPFGTFGAARQGLGLHHQWLRAIQNGWQGGLEQFSYAVMAARSNRFEFPQTAKPTINSTYAYAYHFDASLYAQYARSIAEQRGVTRTEGKVQQVRTDPDTGDVSSLELQSGELIQGDLFIDCSGFRSLILGSTLGVEWEDWKQWLPCDRALAVPSASAAELTPYTRSTAMEAGWRWRIPLQHRTGNGYVFSSSFIEESAAADALLEGLDAPAIDEPRLLRFAAGRRRTSWNRNCVALGLSSGFLEPLESTSIYLIQIAIMHMLPLLPKRRGEPGLSQEFNRKMDLEYERIRDFLILHYHLNSRDDGELWRYSREMEVPDSLMQKMEMFRHCGHIEQYRDGLFSPPSWLSVYIGQGLTPERYHPLADNVPLERLIADLESLQEEIEDRVDEMPRHSTFLARYVGAEAKA